MSSRDRRPPADLFLIRELIEDRAKRLDDIRAHVSDGSYEVSAGDVADAVVAFFSRDFAPGVEGNTGSVGECC